MPKGVAPGRQGLNLPQHLDGAGLLHKAQACYSMSLHMNCFGAGSGPKCTINCIERDCQLVMREDKQHDYWAASRSMLRARLAFGCLFSSTLTMIILNQKR